MAETSANREYRDRLIPPQQEELTKKGDFTLFKQMSITNECDAHLHF